MDEELAGVSDEIRAEAQFLASHSPAPQDMGPIASRLTAIADKLLAKSGFEKDEPKTETEAEAETETEPIPAEGSAS